MAISTIINTFLFMSFPFIRFIPTNRLAIAHGQFHIACQR